VTDIGVDQDGAQRFLPDSQAAPIRDVSETIASPGFIDVVADNGPSTSSRIPIFAKCKVTDGVACRTSLRCNRPGLDGSAESTTVDAHAT
jgi:hypothetical protein